MDCVECEKCKVWGKLQSYGIGTALKILFESHVPARNELIAFINTFAKITHSTQIVDIMYQKRIKVLY